MSLQESLKEGEGSNREDQIHATWEDLTTAHFEDGGKGQWAKGASRSYQRQRSRLSSESPLRNEAMPILWFEPSEIYVTLLSSRTIR